MSLVNYEKSEQVSSANNDQQGQNDVAESVHSLQLFVNEQTDEMTRLLGSK